MQFKRQWERKISTFGNRRLPPIWVSKSAEHHLQPACWQRDVVRRIMMKTAATGMWLCLNWLGQMKRSHTVVTWKHWVRRPLCTLTGSSIYNDPQWWHHILGDVKSDVAVESWLGAQSEACVVPSSCLTCKVLSISVCQSAVQEQIRVLGEGCQTHFISYSPLWS